MKEPGPPRRPAAGLVLIGVAVLLFAGRHMLTRGFVHGELHPSLNDIANNLRILEAAKEQYALTHQLPASAPVTEADLLPYLKGEAMVRPAFGEIYTITNVGTLITATLTRGPAAGKSGPFTITSF